MRHKGKAAQAALKLILWSLLILLALGAGGVLAKYLAALIAEISMVLVALWVLFAVFCFYFFRDPDPRVPSDPGAIVSPAYGTVDLIDETEEPRFMGGRCRRISIFLSVVDVHVQYAPVAGTLKHLEHSPGGFANAMRAASCEHNEQVLLGFHSTERAEEKIGVRLLAGLIARRIVPWIQPGDRVERGERISLIQFGSRCDLYLPLHYPVVASPGQKVRGGETILARRG